MEEIFKILFTKAQWSNDQVFVRFHFPNLFCGKPVLSASLQIWYLEEGLIYNL